MPNRRQAIGGTYAKIDLSSRVMPSVRRFRWVELAAILSVGMAAAAVGLASTPTQVGPDASGYLAVASGLRHGLGLAYPDGAPVVERPPLFALLTSTGGESGAALVVAGTLLSKLGFLAFALTVGTLAAIAGQFLAGPAVRFIAVATAGLVIVLTPLFVEWQGAVLIDGLQATLGLAAVGIWPILTHGGHRRAVAAGVLFGLAVLVKESAVLLLLVPLGLEVWMGHRGSLGRLAAAAMVFGAVVAPWWAWVGLHTGRIYMVGLPIASGLAIGLVMILLLVGWLVVERRRAGTHGARADTGSAGHHRSPIRLVSLAALIAAWLVLAVVGLEATADQPISRSVAGAILRYGRLVLDPSLPLYPLILLTTAGGFVLALRKPTVRPIALAFVASLPLLEFTVLRGWQARNFILLLGAGAVLTGVFVGWSMERIAAWVMARRAAQQPAAAAVLGIATVMLMTGVGLPETVAALDLVRQRSIAGTWDHAGVRDVANWLAGRSSPGDMVLASWRFGAQWYVHGDARFHVRQIPLVQVRFRPPSVAEFQAMSTFDRWEDHRLPPRTVGPILAAASDRSGALIALERPRLQNTLAETQPRWLVLVTGGPPLRDAARYPNLPALLGATGPEFEVTVGEDTVAVYALPDDAAARLAAAPKSMSVALTAALAGELTAGSQEQVAARLASLGISSIVLTDGIPLPVDVANVYRSLGIGVTISP